MNNLNGYDINTAQVVLEESARLCESVVAPLNREGDNNPGNWNGGVVTTTPGFKEAFRQFAEGGWQGVMHPVLKAQLAQLQVTDAGDRNNWFVFL